MSIIKLAARGYFLKRFLKKNKKLMNARPSILDEKFGYKKAKNAIKELNGITPYNYNWEAYRKKMGVK